MACRCPTNIRWRTSTNASRAHSDGPAGVSTELTLGTADFARALGTTVADLHASVRARIEGADFRYQPLASAERAEVIAGVRARIDSGDLSTVGEHRQGVWETGWEENVEAFASSGFAL